MPDEIAEVIRTVVAPWAEDVRAALGNNPVGVVSWYRCLEHHKAIYAAKIPPQVAPLNSQHLVGRALDIAVSALTPSMVQHRLQSVYWPSLVRGLGRYPGSTHIDCRTTEPELWS